MPLNNKKVLITGISGFVGSLLAKALLDQEAEVFGLLRRRGDGITPRNLSRLGITEEVRFIEGDLENISSLGDSLNISEPDMIFHLAAQSFVPRSFSNPLETMSSNVYGTANLLEAIRIKDLNPVVIFAASSEEYGFVVSSEAQYKQALEKHGTIFPEPERIPELPISETNPLRPMSPYAVSKVYGDFLMRNYWHSYGIKTIVSRAFNHEGAGRGNMFVTSVITNQTMKLKFGDTDSIVIGNVNAFRDWSHISDIISGYILLAEKGKYGDVYNQGSMRTNSVLSYLLLSLAEAGYHIDKVETVHGKKKVEDPLETTRTMDFGVSFEKTKIDDLMLNGELEFGPDDGGLVAHAGEIDLKIIFDTQRFRPAEVPILLSDTRKIARLGFRVEHGLKDIIRDQLNHYLSEKYRKGS
ncbi:MAG: GDP-mannose 4,6-dehydratase [Methanotrichaceae archaeon]|nr:GDP-mannose 4,6-dehydratase [Methanotrichaceae archaeon]